MESLSLKATTLRTTVISGSCGNYDLEDPLLRSLCSLRLVLLSSILEYKTYRSTILDIHLDHQRLGTWLRLRVVTLCFCFPIEWVRKNVKIGIPPSPSGSWTCLNIRPGFELSPSFSAW